MKKTIILNKKEGETPLAALERFRSKNKRYEGIRMTYAGRLDPMAEGLLLILAGEEVKQKEKYLALDKVYEFEVLFGASTDTYDILGKVAAIKILPDGREFKKSISDNLKHFTGKFLQKYPLYSSKAVKGKPLFKYGREGLGVEAPEKEVAVKDLKFLKLRKISKEKLLKNIEKRVIKVKGDFRQGEILKIWRKKLKGAGKEFIIGSFRIKCGSGTYVRGIADSLGQRIGTPALAFQIKRTRLGKWRI